MRRYLKIITIVFLLVIALLAAGSGIIVHFFQDEVIRFVIDGINKQVTSRIQVQSAHFSVFRKFPNASVEFRHVEMSPAQNFDVLSFDAVYSRNLLVAERVFAELNLFRLLKKDFRITKIEIQNGNINMLTDKNNQHNFIFWKTSENVNPTDTTIIELQNVTLRNVNVYYSHKRSNTVISLHAEKSRINGRFTSRQYSLGTDWSGMVQYFSVDGNTFIKNKPMELSGKLDVDNNTFSILESTLSLAQVDMDVSGGFSTGDVVDLDLHVTGKRLDYPSLVSVIPEQYAGQLHNYPGKGVFNFSVDVTGIAGTGKNPHVEAKFSMANGLVTHSQTKVKLSDLSFSGSFTNGTKNQGTTTAVHVQNFGFKISNGSIKGSLLLQDFRKPSITLKINGNTDLEQLYRFVPLKQISHISGQANGNLTASVRLKKPYLSKADDITQLTVEGPLTLDDVSIRLNNQPYRFSRINGALQFDKYVNLKGLSFVLNDNDFLANGHIEKLFPYLLGQSQTMHIEANVASRNLCVDSLLYSGKPSPSATTTANNSEGPLLLPENITFNTNLTVENFRYRNVSANRLKADLAYKPRMMAVHSVTFATMSGNVTGSGTVANDAADNIRLLGETTLSHIDIRQMFQTFNNFSQNVVRAEHLKGALSGDISFAIGWDNRMRLRNSDIEVESSLELTGGELTGFEPMTNLSRFVALEELQNVRFSTLHTRVFIKDGEITLPETNIETSAFSISGSGVHYFNNSYTYRVKVLLSELLAAKARKNKRENHENEYTEDGGKRTAIYLKVIGTGEDFKISYDKQSAKESVAADIKQEKQNLKSILKDEFGWFKKDSTLVQPATPNNTGKLRFSFDEDNPQTQQETTVEKSTKKNRQKKPVEKDETIKVDWE